MIYGQTAVTANIISDGIHNGVVGGEEELYIVGYFLLKHVSFLFLEVCSTKHK